MKAWIVVLATFWSLSLKANCPKESLKACQAFQGLCSNASLDYPRSRTLSCILNDLRAYDCSSAFDLLQKEKKLRLDDQRFRIASLEPISYLDFLEELTLRNQQIVDISPLKSLKKLRRLSLADNDISNIEVLVEFKALRALDLRGNPLEDVSVLEKLPKLELLAIDAKFKSKLNRIKLNEKLRLQLRP